MGTTEESTTSPTIPNNTPTNILTDLGGLSLSTSSPAPQSQVSSPSTLSQFTSPPLQSQVTPMAAPPRSNAPSNNMDDLLGIFGGAGQSNVGGFGDENVWSDIPQQNGSQPAKKKPTNEDILGLF
jgi:hypothetical protein